MSPMADSPRFNPYRKPHSAASARSIQVPRSTLPPRLKRSLIPRTPFENDKDQEPARSSIDYSQVPTSPGSFPDPELPPPPLLVEWNAKAPQTSTQSLVALQEIVQVGPQGVVRRRRLVPIPPDTTNTNAPARSHVSGTSSTRIRLKGNGHARQVRIIQPPPQESMGLGDSSINPIEIDGMDKSTTPVVLSARRVWQSNKSPRVFIGKIQEQRGGVQLQPVLLWSLARPRPDPHMTQDISEKLLQNSPLRAGEQQFQFDFQIMKQPEVDTLFYSVCLQLSLTEYFSSFVDNANGHKTYLRTYIPMLQSLLI